VERHPLGLAGGGFDLFVAVVAVASFIGIERFKAGIMPVIGACAVLWLIWRSIVS